MRKETPSPDLSESMYDSLVRKFGDGLENKRKRKNPRFPDGKWAVRQKNVQIEKRKIIWEKQNKPILYIIKEGKVRSGCAAAACLEIKKEFCLPSVVMTAYRDDGFSAFLHTIAGTFENKEAAARQHRSSLFCLLPCLCNVYSS